MNIEQTKSELLTAFETYPVMTRSMISQNVFGVNGIEITSALDELVDEGQLLRGAKPGKRRATAFFFLASEAERLEPFVNPVRKAKK